MCNVTCGFLMIRTCAHVRFQEQNIQQTVLSIHGKGIKFTAHMWDFNTCGNNNGTNIDTVTNFSQ